MSPTAQEELELPAVAPAKMELKMEAVWFVYFSTLHSPIRVLTYQADLQPPVCVVVILLIHLIFFLHNL